MFQKSMTLKRCAVVASIFVLFVVSLVIATEAGKKRDFQGRGEFWFCKKTNDGKWEVFDKWKPDLTFKVSVIDAARKEFTSEGTWSGETEKGHRISVRLSGTGRAKVNLIEGTVEVVDLPFAFTVDGKNLNESFKATSGTTEGATGPISGQRAVFDSAAHTLTFAVVGSKQVRVPSELVDSRSETRADQSKGSADPNKNATQTILVVGRLEGKFKRGD
jgi:hypothetical protein